MNWKTVAKGWTDFEGLDAELQAQLQEWENDEKKLEEAF